MVIGYGAGAAAPNAPLATLPASPRHPWKGSGPTRLLKNPPLHLIEPLE